MLLDRVLAPVEQQPDAPAFVFAGQPVSYRHFRALLCRAVVHLRGQGINAGDVVGLEMSQSPVYVIVLLALGWIGALTVPVAISLRPADREQVLRKFRLVALVADRLVVVPPGCRLVQMQGIGARGDETMEDAGLRAPADSPFRLALTSGTTGVPRGVVQTLASFEERMDRMHCDVVDRPVVLPPALHITIAANLVMHALCKGGTIVLPKGYGNKDFFDAVHHQGVTHVTAPPANLALMLRSLPPSGPAFPRVKHLRLVGSTPTRGILDAARKQFSPHVYVPYGLAEVGVVSMATPEMLAEDPTSVGPLEPGVRMELTAEGEIGVFIPGMPHDYYGPDEGQHARRFHDGLFWPGDRVRVANGRLYVEGRVDNIINAGGRKVSPEYVESILMEFPGVREAAVYPVDDGAGGTAIAAAIVPGEAFDWAGLRGFATQRLHVSAPGRYKEVASLPRNAMGKLDREALASLPAADRG